jgi:hypothetical protein
MPNPDAKCKRKREREHHYAHGDAIERIQQFWNYASDFVPFADILAPSKDKRSYLDELTDSVIESHIDTCSGVEESKSQ